MLLVKKKLDIKLTVEDRSLNDKKVLEIILTIENGFDAAANEVIAILKNIHLSENENKSSHKTQEMLDFFYNGNNKKSVANSQKVQCYNISDGEYVAFDIEIKKEQIIFKFGKSIYKLPYIQSLVLNDKIKKARVSVSKGSIVNLIEI